MNDLIERIEAASGNDAELFWEAHRIANPKPAKVWMNAGRGLWTPEYAAYIAAGHRFSELIEAGAFTDAALTLVPEWFEWSLEYQAGHHVSSDVECMVAIAKLGDPCRDWESESYTPALALCAAALKARAYLKETNNAD